MSMSNLFYKIMDPDQVAYCSSTSFL